MKMPFISDRREKGRREQERRKAARGDSDRRASERRAAQRREDVRLMYPSQDSPQLVAYPPGAEPEILKAEPRILMENLRITDICRRAVRFVCEIDCSRCTKPLVKDEHVGFTIRFHDDETVDLTGTIMRYTKSAPEDKGGTAVCVLTVYLEPERITKEQRYLLQNYPDFCRATQKDKRHEDVSANA